MRSVLALAVKDLRLLVRDRPGLFFTLAFPFLIAVFFGLMFSGGAGPRGGIPVAIVDEDVTSRSRAMVQALRAAPELRGAVAPSDRVSVPFTREEAADLVRRGRVTAAITLRPGFGNDVAGFSAPAGEVEIAVDPSRSAEAGMIQGIVTRYAYEQFTRRFRDPVAMQADAAAAREALAGVEGLDPLRRGVLDSLFASLQQLGRDIQDRPRDAANPGPTALDEFEPVRVTLAPVVPKRDGPSSSFAVTFPQAVLWGMAGCAASFGLSLVVERSRGTLLRVRTAPLTMLHILGGKALACLISTWTVAGALLAFAWIVFGVRPVSVPTLSLAVVCVSLCFVGLMMLLAVVGRSEASAGTIGWAVMLVMLMVGGGAVPLFMMPAWMQKLSGASPAKWGILAIEGGVWRGLSAAEMFVPCAILLSVGAIAMSIGVVLFRVADAGE